jgi:hypothetical protein
MHQDARRTRAIEVGVDQRLHLAGLHANVTLESRDVAREQAQIALGMRHLCETPGLKRVRVDAQTLEQTKNIRKPLNLASANGAKL